jgi:hypothetical protein
VFSDVIETWSTYKRERKRVIEPIRRFALQVVMKPPTEG